MALEIPNVLHAIGIASGGLSPALLGGVGFASQVVRAAAGVYRLQTEIALDAAEALVLVNAPAGGNVAPVCDGRIVSPGVVEAVISSAGLGVDPPYFQAAVLRFRSGAQVLPPVAPVALAGFPGGGGLAFAGSTVVQGSLRVPAGGSANLVIPIPAAIKSVFSIQITGVGAEIGSIDNNDSGCGVFPEGVAWVQRDAAGALGTLGAFVNIGAISTLGPNFTANAPSTINANDVTTTFNNLGPTDRVLHYVYVLSAPLPIPDV